MMLCVLKRTSGSLRVCAFLCGVPMPHQTNTHSNIENMFIAKLCAVCFHRPAAAGKEVHDTGLQPKTRRPRHTHKKQLHSTMILVYEKRLIVCWWSKMAYKRNVHTHKRKHTTCQRCTRFLFRVGQTRTRILYNNSLFRSTQHIHITHFQPTFFLFSFVRCVSIFHILRLVVLILLLLLHHHQTSDILLLLRQFYLNAQIAISRLIRTIRRYFYAGQWPFDQIFSISIVTGSDGVCRCCWCDCCCCCCLLSCMHTIKIWKRKQECGQSTDEQNSRNVIYIYMYNMRQGRTFVLGEPMPREFALCTR